MYDYYQTEKNHPLKEYHKTLYIDIINSRKQRSNKKLLNGDGYFKKVLHTHKFKTFAIEVAIVFLGKSKLSIDLWMRRQKFNNDSG